MDKVKKLLILTIGIILLWGSITGVEASSFQFDAKAEKEEVKAGDIIKIDMKVNKIDAGVGINVVQAELEYDETVFEEITFEDSNEWTTVYQEEDPGKGKFIVTKLVEGVAKREKISQIQLKLKEDIKEGTQTEVKINEITSNDGSQLIDEGNRVIKIKTMKEKQADKPNKTDDSDQVVYVQPDEDYIKYPDADEGKGKGIISSILGDNVKTGDEIVVIVIMAVILIGVNLVYFVLKAKQRQGEGKETYKKRMIILFVVSILLMVLVIFLSKDVTALKEVDINEMIQMLTRENEDNPESKDYLITDTTISRIRPGTTVEMLESKIENIKIKEKIEKDQTHTTIIGNATKNTTANNAVNQLKSLTKENSKEEWKEVKDKTQLVKTGMIAEFQENGKIYEISVLGDINADGMLNQIELTRTIREYIKSRNWRIEKEIERLSADVTCDGSIDEKDINSMIDYILLEELEVKVVDPVKAPKIEIIQGDELEKGRYNSEVTVKITQENEPEKTAKTVYKIAGTQTIEEKEIHQEENIKITDTGVYKITSYTYGKEGNKSKATSEIIVIHDKIEAPQIAIEPETWTNEKVKVSIQEKEGCQAEYKINEGEWTAYAQAFDVEENTKVTARLVEKENEGNKSEETVKEIDNIDKEKPTGKIEIIGKGTSKIALALEGQDKELSGIKEIRVYSKESTATDYECKGTFTYEENEEKNNKKQESLVISGLKAKTQYDIYLEVEDRAGNVYNKDNEESDKPDQENIAITTTTEETATPVIITNPTVWTNQKVSVIIEGEDKYYTQYKIGEGEWTAYTEALEVEENTTITARLVEQANEANISQEVTKEITNIDKVLPTGTITAGAITTNSIELNIEGQDETLSGIKAIRVYAKEEVQGATGEVTNDTNINEYTCITSYEYTDEATKNEKKTENYHYQNLKANTSYEVYFEVEDIAGNIYSSKDDTNVNKMILTTNQIGVPTIMATPSETWTNGEVTVTITAPEDKEAEEKVQYVISQEEVTNDTQVEWKDYTEDLTIAENTKVYTRMTDGTNHGTIVKKEITNIDTLKPTGSIRVLETKSNQIIVEIQGQDDTLSGLHTMKVYMKDATSETNDYQCVETYEYGQSGEEYANQTVNCTIDNLQASTNYEIYVEVKDKAGNIYTSQENPIETKTKAEANVTILTTPTTWTNDKVTASIIIPEDYEEEYEVEYIVSKEAVTDQTEGWTKHDVKDTIIIEENTTIYARLVKGETKEKITDKEITNIDKIVPTGTITAGTVTTNAVDLAIEAQDATLAGIRMIRVYAREKVETNAEENTVDSITENTESNSEDEYTCIKTYEYSDEATKNDKKVENYHYENLKENTSYEIYLEVEDRAGNKYSSKEDNNANTILVTTNGIGVPTIVATPSETWTKDSVTVTITAPQNIAVGEKVQYVISQEEITKDSEVEWNDYVDTLTITENTKVYTRMTDGINHGTIVKKEIRNIDTIVPTGAIREVEARANQIEVEIKGKDETLSGIHTMKIYVKEKASGEMPTQPTMPETIQETTTANMTETVDGYQCVKTYEYGETQEEYEEKTENYAITNLQPETSYQIYVEVADKAGNIYTTKDTPIEATTLKEANLTIEATPTTWTNDKVTASITMPEGYQEVGYGVEYILSKEPVTAETDGWTMYDHETKITVEENTTIYARAVKGESKETIATKEITNIDKVVPTGKVVAGVVTTNSIELNIEGQDETLSGIKAIRVYAREKLGGSTTDSTENEYTCIKTYEYSDEATKNEKKVENYQYENLKGNATYEIYVEIEDMVGNIYSSNEDDKAEKLTVTTDGIGVPTIEAIPLETWTNGVVTVSISAPVTRLAGEKIEYVVSKEEVSKDSQVEWTDYVDSLTITENTNVYARITDGINVGEIVKRQIRNIDTIVPTGAIREVEARANQIKVEIKGKDETLSGIHTMKIYVKEKASGEIPTQPTTPETTQETTTNMTETVDGYQCVKTYEYGETQEEYEEKTENYAITNLQPETSYQIYVEVADKAGNIYTTKDTPIEATTLKEANLTIEATPTTWTNDKVTASITMPEGYQEVGYGVEYILSKEPVTEETEGWTMYDHETKITVEENTTIYARAVKGESKETIATKEITNMDKAQPIAEIKNIEIGKTSIVLQVKGQDDTLSGIKEIRAYVQDMQDPELLSESKITYQAEEDYEAKVETIEIEDLTDNTSYEVYLEVEDYAGNVTTTQTQEIKTKEMIMVARVTKIGGIEVTEEEYADYEYETLQEALELCEGETDCKIVMIENSEESNNIVATTSLVLDLAGHTITSKSEGATITNQGTLTILDSGKTIGSEESASTSYGKIENTVGKAIINTGILTIGENGEETPNTENPRIEGKTTGIQAIEGTFNFYDGKVIGATPVEGVASDTPNLNEEEKYIIITLNGSNGNRESYLSTPISYPVQLGPIYYSNLADAIASSQAGETVILLRGSVIGEPQEIAEDKDIILDLKGNTLTSNTSDYVIKNRGKLQIIDSSEGKTGMITSTTSGELIYNAGNSELTIGGGTIEGKIQGSSSQYKSLIKNEGNLTIEGTTKVNATKAYAQGIDNVNDATLTMKGGTITISSTGYGICHESTEGVMIEGGTISASTGIQNKSTGTITVKDGTLQRATYGIYNESTGRVVIEGGRIEGSSVAINNSTGEVNITGGTIYSGNGKGIANNSTGTVNVTGGTVEGSNQAISNSSAGEVNIAGGEVVVGYDRGYGISNTGTINITGGTIQASKTAAVGIYNENTGTINMIEGIINVAGQNAKGIYNQGTGTIILGQDDQNVEEQNLKIIDTGTSAVAIYNVSGRVEYYDGIMEGNNEIKIFGEISQVAEGYQITEETTEELKTIKLVRKEAVASIGTTNYDTLQEAIDACTKQAGEQSTTITLLKNITIVNNSLTVVEGQNITIDFNGNTITNYMKVGGIINHGTLSLTDTAETAGSIIGYSAGVFIVNDGNMKSDVITLKGLQGTLVENSGMLEIVGGTIVVNNVKIGGLTLEKTYGVKNKEEGTVIIKEGATIKAETIENTSYGVYHEGTGSITLEGSTITLNGYGYNYGIYNVGTGEVTVIGGTISTQSSYYRDNCPIYNQAEGTINVRGGNLTATSGSSNTYAINNVGEGTVNVSNHATMTSIKNTTGTINIFESAVTGIVYNYGIGSVILEESNIGSINNQSSGTIQVKSGTVGTTTTSNAIYNHATGMIILGDKDGEVKAQTPEIVGREYGVNINNTAGVLKIYDGVIKGKTSAINVVPNEVEEGYELVKEQEEDTEFEKAYLATMQPVALMNGTNYSSFSELEEAIASLEDNAQTTVEILKNTTILSTANGLTIPENKNIVLDFKGHQIETSKEESIVNYGTLKITDSVQTPGSLVGSCTNVILNHGNMQIDQVTIQTSTGTTLRNDGTLEVLGGTIQNVTSANQTIYTIYNENEGDVTVVGGNVIAKSSSSYGHGIYHASEGTITVTGGKVASESYYSYAINNYSTGTVNVTGGNVEVKGNSRNGSSSGIYNNSTGNVTIDGATMTATGNDSCVLYNTAEGTASVTDSITEGGFKIANGVVTVTNCTGINNITNTNGTVTVTDSNLDYVSNKTGMINIMRAEIANSVYNSGTGTITLEEIEIVNSNATSFPFGAIQNGSSGTIHLISGNITVSSNIVSKRYGIYNESIGTINIGRKDGNLNTQSPNITGSEYGVYMANTSGVLNFYDGVIKGKTGTINVTPNDVEEGYELIKEHEEETGMEKAYLGKLEAVAVMNGTNYANIATLTEAIASLEDNQETTIEMTRDISVLPTGDALTIAENKNIVLDLKGHTIATSKEELIINNGTLKITDSAEIVGKITASATNSISNLGNMQIEQVTIQTSVGSAIKNNGTLAVLGGTIDANAMNSGYAIYHVGEGTVTITGGTISSNSHAIYNYSTGTVQVNGGTILVGDGAGIYNASRGEVHVTAGRIASKSEDSNSYGICNASVGVIDMVGGEIETKAYGIYQQVGMSTISIENVNITANNAIYETNMANGEIHIKNSTITGGINVNRGTVTIEESTVTGSIKNNAGIVNVMSGTIHSNGYGIQNTGAGIINIGQKGGTVSVTMPEIIGETYGIYMSQTTGVLNFYDGVIKGKTGSVYGKMTDIEPLYEIMLTTQDGYECATLTFSSSTNNMRALVNGTYYETIQAAIDATTENDHVVLINGENITEALNVSSDKNIVLDLAGFMINSTSTNHAIVNNGTLRIMDSSEGKTGSIVSKNGTAIAGSGTTNIDSGVHIQDGI